jgi:hypothetical protein
MGPLVDRPTRERLLRGLFTSYYETNPAEVIFDTSRAWTAKLPALTTLFPEAKIICCVRNVAWVMDSIERQFRQNGFENTKLFGLLSAPPSTPASRRSPMPTAWWASPGTRSRRPAGPSSPTAW